MPSRIKTIWKNMRQRCHNPNFIYYHNYGGRGITVCDEWQDFHTFEQWAYANDYSDDLTIDRINTNGNYEPSNCRWTTMKVQTNNKRNNRLITYNGKTQTESQWADELGISFTVLRNRLHKGFPLDKAFEDKDLRETDKITYQGKTQTISEWARETGVNRKNISRRLERGWSLDKVFSLQNFNYKTATN